MTKSNGGQTDHYADAFVGENIAYGYDVVTTLCRSEAYTYLHAHRPIPWNQPLPYIEGLLFMDLDNVTLTSQENVTETMQVQ